MTYILLRDALDDWARTRPDAPAVTFADSSYTWGQWRERILRLTGALRAAGVGRGDRIGVLDLNHLATVELTLAASALGAATAIVNFRLAPEQIAYVLEDSAPVLLFSGPAFADVQAKQRIAIPDEYEGFLAAGTPDDAREADPDDTCLVMYTSGTTGRPKGAELTHRGVTAHSRANQGALLLEDDTTHLVAMPLFHVGGICSAHIGITAGARTILLREPTPAALFGAIAAGATNTFVVPAVIHGVLAGGDQAVAAFGRLRVLSYGASPMPLPMLRRALEAWPQTDFVQVYGMTELSGVATMLGPEEHRDTEHPERLASAGRPVDGVELRVVDPVTGEDVERGATGELWFRTAQRMGGYLHRPEATQDTITPDGWLRSGDVGRVDDDGYVYVLDRVKDMIITGGENVYGPEVESVLTACPGVAEGAVIGVPDERWGERVVAVVVAAPGSDLTEQAVVDFCRGRLAHYQCPTTVEFVEALPRNGAGKVLKHVLREPHWAGRERRI